jgi:hypothetical protein
MDLFLARADVFYILLEQQQNVRRQMQAACVRCGFQAVTSNNGALGKDPGPWTTVGVFLLLLEVAQSNCQ